MAEELPEVQRLRLKLKAGKQLLRDLLVCAAQAEEALERQARHARHMNPQPEEAQGHEQDTLAAA